MPIAEPDIEEEFSGWAYHSAQPRRTLWTGATDPGSCSVNGDRGPGALEGLFVR